MDMLSVRFPSVGGVKKIGRLKMFLVRFPTAAQPQKQKTPPPLVPPRTFIRGSFFENRPSKTVSLQNKQTNKQNQTLYSIYYIIILYIIYYILYIVYYIYMLYVVCCLLFVVYRLKEKISLLDLDYSHRTMFKEARTLWAFFFSVPRPCFQHYFLGYKSLSELGCFRRRTFESI